MNSCSDGCPKEALSIDVRSVGVIEDDELICRASYDPMHYPRGRLQNSFVKAVDLFNGQLSVWRASAKTGLSPSDVAQIVAHSGPPDNTLKAMHAVPAGLIRSERALNSTGRLFCVVDETDIDDQGGSHPAHAHIAICEVQMATIDSRENVLFEYAKQRLIFLLKQPEANIWP